MREDPTSILQKHLSKSYQTQKLSPQTHMPCTQRVNQELPRMCLNNGQKGGSGIRGVELSEREMMYDLGIGSKQSQSGWGCYRSARLVSTHLHMLQVVQSRRTRAKGREFTRSFAGLSSLPVNEFRSFRCNACLDQPYPWYKCCPEQSNIVGLVPLPGPCYCTKQLQLESTGSAA